MFKPNQFPKTAGLLASALAVTALGGEPAIAAAGSGGAGLGPKPEHVRYDSRYDYLWKQGGKLRLTAWPIEKTAHGETHLFAVEPTGHQGFKEVAIPWNARAIEGPYASCQPTSTSGTEFTSSTGLPETKVNFRKTGPVVVNLGHTSVIGSAPNISPYCL